MCVYPLLCPGMWLEFETNVDKACKAIITLEMSHETCVLHRGLPWLFGVWWCVLSSLKCAKKYTDNGGMIRNQYQNHNTVFCAKKSDSPQQYYTI